MTAARERGEAGAGSSGAVPRDAVTTSAASPTRRPPPCARGPAGPVPVAAVVEGTLGPGDDVRRRRADLVVAARAAVGLRRRGPGHRPHHPGTVLVLLDALCGRRAGAPVTRGAATATPEGAGHGSILPDRGAGPGPPAAQ